eukprot:UN04025
MLLSQHLFVDGGIVYPYVINDKIRMMHSDEYWTEQDDIDLQKYYNNPHGIARPIAYGTEMPYNASGLMMNIVGDDDDLSNNNNINTNKNNNMPETPQVNYNSNFQRSALNSPVAGGQRSIAQYD